MSWRNRSGAELPAFALTMMKSLDALTTGTIGMISPLATLVLMR
jgi:hypothetical protein